MVREKYMNLENEIFSRLGGGGGGGEGGVKSGNFVDGQENLERTWKTGEKSWNLKINGYGRPLLQKIYSVQVGNRCTFS